jgi:hypothetical protein
VPALEVVDFMAQVSRLAVQMPLAVTGFVADTPLAMTDVAHLMAGSGQGRPLRVCQRGHGKGAAPRQAQESHHNRCSN